MRSVVQNHLMEFLEILSYDKTEWLNFWREYRRRYGPVVPNYEKAHDLTEEDVERLLWNLERRSLDRLKRYWESVRPEEKRKISHGLRRRGRELELWREDFVVFLFGGLGISDWTIVRGKKEHVILVDVVKVWKDGKVKDLSPIVLEAVRDFRRSKCV